MSNTTAQPVLSISHGFASGCSSSLLTGDSYSRGWQRTYRFTLTPGAFVHWDMRSLQRPVQPCFTEHRTKLAVDLYGHAGCFVGLLLGHIGELWLSGAPGKAASAVPDVDEKPAQFSAGVIFRQRGHARPLAHEFLAHEKDARPQRESVHPLQDSSHTGTSRGYFRRRGSTQDIIDWGMCPYPSLRGRFHLWSS